MLDNDPFPKRWDSRLKKESVDDYAKGRVWATDSSRRENLSSSARGVRT